MGVLVTAIRELFSGGLPLSEQMQPAPLCQAFECVRIDSASCSPDLFPVPARSHYFSEVLLVRSGTCRVVRGAYVHILSPGELVYIAPLVPHSVDSADGGPVVFDVVKFSATRLMEIPSWLSALRSIALDASSARLPVHMSVEEVKTWHMDNIVQECLVESERQYFAWDLHIRALIYLLITGLARFWISRQENLTDHAPVRRDPILDIPAYIEQHISESLRVEDLAHRCSLSYPWFAKRFHEFFGISCKQFIEHVRTEVVEQYLVHTNLDLTEISQLTGYTDSSHMVKDFKRMTGMTPGQFRSTLRMQGSGPFSSFSGQSLPNRPSKG